MTGVSYQTQRIYAEVYGILNFLGKEFVEKIPNNIYENICKLKLEDYNPEYDENKSLKQQHVSRDALSIIAFLHISYCCDDINEKEKLKKIFKENSIKDNNIVFDTVDNSRQEQINVSNNTNLPIEVKKENIIGKILNFIKNIFNKKNK